MRRLGLGLLAAAALALPGCPAAHDDFPTTTCTSQQDCFQGEVCEIATGQESGKCVPDVARDMASLLMMLCEGRS